MYRVLIIMLTVALFYDPTSFEANSTAKVSMNIPLGYL